MRLIVKIIGISMELVIMMMAGLGLIIMITKMMKIVTINMIATMLPGGLPRKGPGDPLGDEHLAPLKPASLYYNISSSFSAPLTLNWPKTSKKVQF